MWELEIRYSKYQAQCLSLYVLRISSSDDKSQKYLAFHVQCWEKVNEVMLIGSGGETDVLKEI